MVYDKGKPRFASIYMHNITLNEFIGITLKKNLWFRDLLTQIASSQTFKSLPYIYISVT